MLRNKKCGELRKENIGQEVILTGWVSKIRNFGSLVFVDLRDRYGLVQLKLSTSDYKNYNLKNEDCIQVTGNVVLRSDINKNIPTGEIEVEVTKIVIFAHSNLTPFIIADKTDALEDTRLKTRYLDLRRPILQHNLILRHKILKASRDFLENEDFLEIETPTLVKSTPEGARDYLVPSRIKPGQFYALPQSPQIYKQLLMISGMDRYYQIARCYRDEDLRADRQPEFTQVDVEMSFVEREDVLNVIENLVKYIWKQTINYDLKDFVRIPYLEAIDKYGSDKPDLRYDMQLVNLTSIISNGSFEAFKNKVIKGIVIKNYASKITRKLMDKDNELVKKYKLHGVSFFKYENNELTSSLNKFYSKEVLDQLVSYLNLEDNDLLIVAANESNHVVSVGLGALRCQYAKVLNLTDPNVFAPCFVIDWPLFEKSEDHYESLSNPFTRPRDEDLKYLDSDPCKVLSYAYDTVINGMELSSGALRIYDGSMQQKIFELLGLTNDDIKNRFGFFVDAFNYGTPPHGGFALGVERMAMLLCKTDNVRDVVAFPKNLQASDPMAECPSKVPNENLDILGIQIKESE